MAEFNGFVQHLSCSPAVLDKAIHCCTDEHIGPISPSTFCSPMLLLPEETDRRDPPRPRPAAPGTSNHCRGRESGSGVGGRCTDRGRNTTGDKLESSAES